MATLLSMIQDAADIIGIQRPVGVVAGSDQTTRTFLSCAQREGRALARRWTWQALTKEHTFTSTATTTQATGLPSDWGNRMLSDTFFNRTMKRVVRGPLNPREWQAQQALTAAVLFDAFRIRGNALDLIPTPSAGWTYAYEYVSENWCESALGVEQSGWVADTDVPLLDVEAMTLGIVWRFLHSRGLDYAEAMRDYETQVLNLMARDGSRRAVDMTGTRGLGAGARYPLVPEGSWVV
jgi:hypothetical protein